MKGESNMNITKREQKGSTIIFIEDISDREFRWPNLSGRPDGYGNTGKNFKVEIPESEVNFFRDDGVNVGEWMPKDAEDPQIIYTVKVNISVNEFYPLHIYLINGSDSYELKETEFHTIDDIYRDSGFDKIDLKIRERRTKDPNRRSLYLAEGYFYEAVDDFAKRHRMVASASNDFPNVGDLDEEKPFD